jgi:23S rRNA pseudouridine1911/1915/1917 synthase
MMPSQPVERLYEDNHVLVVVKPPNVPTQADHTGDMDFLTTLKEDIKIRFAKPGAVFLGIVHRLDRPVGGVMVFARTSKAASRLSEQIRNRTFGKTYVALVNGQPNPGEAELTHWLLKDHATNTVRIVQSGVPDAKEARLAYRTLSSEPSGISRMEIQLFTGRSHQIRVQMAAVGCPLVGDGKYGRQAASRELKLWSRQIQFEHPTTREAMQFQSDPPW